MPLLAGAGYRVLAYTRQSCFSRVNKENIEFRQLNSETVRSSLDPISNWICLAPIWVLQQHFPLLLAHGIKRIVVLGSTSVFTKQNSSSDLEQEVVKKLAEGEQSLILWATEHEIEWVILRPTLIYGNGKDRNICEIARFIRRFGFFPLLGEAQGLRQPVHVNDVAAACVNALTTKRVSNCAYNLSGAEQLNYREMVVRVFHALGKSVRFVKIPAPLFYGAVICVRILPRFRKLSFAMAERMQTDMVFDYTAAMVEFHFEPSNFKIAVSDLPS